MFRTSSLTIMNSTQWSNAGIASFSASSSMSSVGGVGVVKAFRPFIKCPFDGISDN